jgi:hypothetical protein
LAWKMLDEHVVGVSAASVYLCYARRTWSAAANPGPNATVSRGGSRATRPDEQWQTDLRYVKVGGGLHLLSFLDVYPLHRALGAAALMDV